jgi:hypothetical protein
MFVVAALSIVVSATTPPALPAPDAVPNDVAGDDGGGEDAETVVRAKRPTRPGVVDVPVRRHSLAVGGASAAQLLQLVPGVFVSQHAGQGKAPQLFMRGFDAEHGQDIEVSVNGISINEVSNVHGQGYADTTFIPIDVVRTLRVSEGVSDPRQGDFALAGSVDYRLGLREPGFVARGSLGRFGLARVFVGARPHHNDVADVIDADDTYVAAELVRGDGFGASRAFERASVVGGTSVVAGAALRLSTFVASSFSQFQSAGVIRDEDVGDGPVDDDVFFSTYDDGQGGSSERHLLGVSGRFNGEAGITSLRGSVGRRVFALRSNFTGALLFPEGDAVEQTSHADTVIIDVEHDVRLTLGGQTHQLVVGAMGRSDHVVSTQRRLRGDDGVPHTNEVDADLDLGHGAVFVDSLIRPWSWLQLRLGGRAEGVSFAIQDHLDDGVPLREATGLFIGPRVSLAARLVQGLGLSASYGEGFRTPQGLSLARGEVPPIAVARTGDIALTLGASRASASWLMLRGSTFFTHVDADRVFDHATATSVPVGPTLRTGLSAFADVGVSTDDGTVGVTASATAVAAQFVDGGALPFAPPLTTRLDLFVERAFGRVFGYDVVTRVEAGASAISARPLPFGDSADAVALVDGGVSLGVGDVNVALEALNVTDARTADGAFTYASRFDAADSAVPARHLTAAPPRLLQVVVGVRLP